MIAVVNATWEAAAAPTPQSRYLPAPCIGELAGPHMGACYLEILWIGSGRCACSVPPPDVPMPEYIDPRLIDSLVPTDESADRLNALERMKLEGDPRPPAANPDVRPVRVEFRRA